MSEQVRFGFTGTREGMSARQKERLRVLLTDLHVTHFHHGDCKGADEEAHDIARALGLYITAHPPDNDALRAFCEADETREPKPYLVRNKDIVNETSALIAAPATGEVLKSGTWSTVRHARRAKKSRYVLTR